MHIISSVMCLKLILVSLFQKMYTVSISIQSLASLKKLQIRALYHMDRFFCFPTPSAGVRILQENADCGRYSSLTPPWIIRETGVAIWVKGTGL